LVHPEVSTGIHPEGAAAARIVIRDEADLRRGGAALLRRLQAQAVLITRGEHGMSLFETAHPVTHIPTFARQVYDVTGASVVVGKRSTATDSRVELTGALRDGEA